MNEHSNPNVGQLHEPRSEGAAAERPVIEFHLGEIVLRGFQPQDHHRIGDAIEREFHALLSGPDALTTFAQSRQLDHVNAGDVQLDGGTSAHKIGQQIARGIYGGLQQ